MRRWSFWSSSSVLDGPTNRQITEAEIPGLTLNMPPLPPPTTGSVGVGNDTKKTGIKRFFFSESYTRKPSRDHDKPASFPRSSRSKRRALKSALVIRSLIVGPSTASPQLTKPVTTPQLSKVKSQLMNPKTANKVIAELRSLPTSNEAAIQGPIHAVCLEHPDDEMNNVYFANIFGTEQDGVRSLNLPAATSVSLSTVTALFGQMNIIDLIQTPDFGFGQPGDRPGLLAGSVPTAETVLLGIEQITPQLMALGYATGRGILPDHTGVYPPKDRMSVLTYWWGLELVLPPPSVAYLNRVQSIPDTVVNFLTALSLMDNGVREILPFIRYIAQFINFEFKYIQGQDRGRGVVCAATWIMPAAMVPRPWDFPDPPEEKQGASLDRPGDTSPSVVSPLPSSPPPSEGMVSPQLDNVMISKTK